jgi:translation initiation factor 1
MTRPDPASRLVYSTETGRICPACGQPVAACRCRADAAARPSGDGAVRVSRESKGRGGKTVTLVRGLPLPDAELAALGKALRSACGSGGTVKDGVLEIQGDHRERVLELLLQRGFKARSAGG